MPESSSGKAPAVASRAAVSPAVVLYVVRPAGGGMLQHVVSLLARLDRGRYQPVVMAGAGEPVAEAAQKLDVPVIRASFGPSLAPVAEIRHVCRIKAAIRATGASLVHAHGFRVSVPGRVATRLAGVPAVYTVHNSLLTAAARGGAKRKVYTTVERGLVSSTALYIAVSGAIERELSGALKVPAAKIATIPNGIDPVPFVEAAGATAAGVAAAGMAGDDASARRHGTPGGGAAGFTGITVSRLIPTKGVADLLDALGLLAARGIDFRWQVVGDGPQREELETRARTLGIAERVFFAGHRPAGELPRLLAAADVFALPSRSEAAGIAVLEAMASGLPVVAAKSGGVPELVRDGQTGFLVDAGRPEELAAAIERVFAEPQLAAALGAKGRARVLAEFSAEAMVARTQEAYDAVLRRVR